MNSSPTQAGGNANFDGLTDIIHRLLCAAWGEDWGTFCEAFPNGREPKNVQLPVITYTLKEMVPGVISKSGTREIKPRHRATFRTEPGVRPEQVVEVYGRVLDAQVLFEVWEENNSKATELATRFMDFLDMYTGYIQGQGVKEVIFQKYTNETEAGAWRDNIVCRSLYYRTRFEHLSEVPVDVFEKVTGSVNVVKSLDEPDDSINEAITFRTRS